MIRTKQKQKILRRGGKNTEWFAIPFSSGRSVQETVMRTIPKKKKCKKGKMVV